MSTSMQFLITVAACTIVAFTWKIPQVLLKARDTLYSPNNYLYPTNSLFGKARLYSLQVRLNNVLNYRDIAI